MILPVSSNVAAVAAKAAEAASYSPLNTILNVVAIGLLSMVLNHMRLSRKIALEKAESDRSGWGELIATLQGQVDRQERQIERQEKQIKEQDARIDQLEEGKHQDHRLIIEMLGQLNRNQAAAILTSNNMSPQLRRAIDSTLEGIPG